LRFLVRLACTGAPGQAFLRAMKALAASVGVDARNPKWTSYGALELDVFSPTREDFDLFLAATGPMARVEFATDLSKPQPYMPDDEILSKARELFNAERYWECHEILESLWRQKQGDEKSLLQGIILVCAAFVHHQKGEEEVAFSVLGRGLRQLGHRSGRYGVIDAGRMRERVEEILAQKKFHEFSV